MYVYREPMKKMRMPSTLPHKGYLDTLDVLMDQKVCICIYVCIDRYMYVCVHVCVYMLP